MVCNPIKDGESNKISSEYINILRKDLSIWHPTSNERKSVIIKTLMNKLSKAGDNKLPCLTPLPTENKHDSELFQRIRTNNLLYQQ